MFAQTDAAGQGGPASQELFGVDLVLQRLPNQLTPAEFEAKRRFVHMMIAEVFAYFDDNDGRDVRGFQGSWLL